MPEARQSGPENALSAAQVESVRQELELVLVSNAFAGSKRCQEFLRLVVNRALAGEIESLRERMIGVEMFGRRVDYDTSNDAVVRVRATEVRKRLGQYYAVADRSPAVRIELPSGSYVPRFFWRELAAAPEIPPVPERVAVPEPKAPPEPTDSHVRISAGRSSRKPLLIAGGVVCLLLLAAILLFALRRWFPVHHGIQSIVVLPLENLSGNPKQDYFADALTEELTTDLGQVSALRVISRTSAMMYRNTNKSVPEIARELNVDGVVEGSVIREGNEARITAQLIDARTDHHLWARSYDRNLTNVLALQGEVAEEIADAIRIELTPDEKSRLTRVRPVNVNAQDLYLLGMHSLDQANPGEAMGYFQKALDIDPDYARAHAALADCYGWLGRSGLMAYSEAYPGQKAEAVKAIDLDDTLPEAHVELASAAENLDWDWASEEKELKRALDLNPNSASAHWAYALMLEKLGRTEEALAQLRIMQQLDPVSTRADANSGFVYIYARQYDRALERIAQVDAPYERYFWHGVIYREQGRYPEAIQAFLHLGDQPHALGHLGNTYARAGRVAEARALIPRLEEHIRKDGVGTYEIALIYAGLGEKDNAFEWLEKAYTVRDKGLTYLKIDPCLDTLRSDPRFQELLGRVGLPR